MPRVSTQQPSSQADYVLLSYFFVLLLFGLIMLTSASAAVGFARFGDTYFFIKRQLLFGVIPGLVLFFFFSKISYQALKSIGFWIFLCTLVLLLVVLIPGVGSTLDTGSRSWIILGGTSFQPSEFAKLGLIFFLALFLARQGKRLHQFKEGFLVSLGLGLIPVFLVVLQPDLGTVSILFGIIFGMLFLAEAKLTHLGFLGVVALVAFILMVVVAPYRTARFTTFLHPELDPEGIGYHINQSFLAIGSGGWFGLGLGHSRQKFQYLPEVQGDSIFAVIAEEMGFFMTAGLILLLILIAHRGILLARRTPDIYGRFLIGGIIIWFMIQSFFNISAMVGLMPITGLPLPFVSHGGTALAVAFAAVGVIANVSKRTYV